ncbi:hypothetical protein DL95DRAFT_484088 [Leptodontidium sp. 2 PMI_412]|nr:hypothetical protein DL95DRAFT_484088 [Leptodontidium sp. 2 PMI_412]
MSMTKTTGIMCTSLLRTCKYPKEVGAPILYSNRFVFDIRRQAPFTHARCVHGFDASRKSPHLIPGLTYPESTNKVRFALSHMFFGNITHHDFLRRDPITSFFLQISPENASFIKDVRVEGFVETVEEGQNRREYPIGLLDILPIYTTIFKNCSPQLQHLTIFQGSGAGCLRASPIGNGQKTEEQRMDDAISNIVKCLPRLKAIELSAPVVQKKAKRQKVAGDVLDPADRRIQPWGSAVRWEAFVAARTAK